MNAKARFIEFIESQRETALRSEVLTHALNSVDAIEIHDRLKLVLRAKARQHSMHYVEAMNIWLTALETELNK